MLSKDNTYLELLGEDICEVYPIKKNNSGMWGVEFQLNKPYEGKQVGFKHIVYRFHENDAKEVFDFLYNSMVSKRVKLRILNDKQKMMLKEFSERKKFDSFQKILSSKPQRKTIPKLEEIAKEDICEVYIKHLPMSKPSPLWVIEFKLNTIYRFRQAGLKHYLTRIHENDAQDIYELLYYSMMSKIANKSCETEISNDEQKKMLELFSKVFPKEIS